MSGKIPISSESATKGICSHANHCGMYSQFGQSGLIKIWKDRYCESNYTDCVRFHLAAIGEVVPPNMLPNGKYLR